MVVIIFWCSLRITPAAQSGTAPLLSPLLNAL
jgi:hypothetical protein